MWYGIGCCARHVAKAGGDRTFSLLSTYVRLNHDWKRVHAEACLHPSCPSSFPVLPHLSSVRADLRCDTAGLCLPSWVAVNHCHIYAHVHAGDSRPLAAEYAWGAIIDCAPPPQSFTNTRWCSPFSTGINQNTLFFSL